jgi:type IV secretory pathway VirB10-like protein
LKNGLTDPLPKEMFMRYFLLTLAVAALLAACGCSMFEKGPSTTTENQTPLPGATAPAPSEPEPAPEAAPEAPAEAAPEEAPAEQNLQPEEPAATAPKPEIPVADADTQKKIDEAIAKFRDPSAKLDEREDAILKTLAGIGAIATPDVLRLTLDQSIETEMMGIVYKFFYVLPAKEIDTALVYQLFNDDSNMRTAANAMLVRLTGKKDIGYDANASDEERYAAAKKWAEALGVEIK